METRLRASPQQFLALIEFMERHGDLSRPQMGLQGRLRGESLWQELTTLLNSISGGVNKTQDKWKKVWADWKSKTKKKHVVIRRHASGTGGGPSSRQTLTVLEERVISITGVSAVVGQADIQEQGCNTPSQPIAEKGSEIEIILELPDIAPSTSAACHAVPEAPAWTPPPPAPATQPSSPSHHSEPPPSPPRRRPQLKARRNRGPTPFARAASEFVAVEQRRLQLEETRERLLHERECERMRLESERIVVAREHNQLLQQFTTIAERLLDIFS